jgi:hypothetical protein
LRKIREHADERQAELLGAAVEMAILAGQVVAGIALAGSATSGPIWA